MVKRKHSGEGLIMTKTLREKLTETFNNPKLTEEQAMYFLEKYKSASGFLMTIAAGNHQGEDLLRNFKEND